MSGPDTPHDRLARLRQSRVRPDADLSLRFLKDQFQRQVAKPVKQLGALTQLWDALVPPHLAEHTRLEGLSRGVLHVAADSSAHRYELELLLRQGLLRQLITQVKGPAIRRVDVRVAGPDAAAPDDPARRRQQKQAADEEETA